MRFGILCGSMLEDWHLHCLRRLLAVTDMELALVMIVDADERARVNRAGGHLWRWCERRWLSRGVGARTRVSVSSAFPDAPKLACLSTVRSEGTLQIGDQDAVQIEARTLDFILRLGTPPLSGRILDAARFGVWCFESEEAELQWGRPSCFWEILDSVPVMRIALLRQSQDPGGSQTLQTGVVKVVDYSYRQSLNAALYASADLLVKHCRAVRAGRVTCPRVESFLPGREHARPTDWQTIRFLLKFGWNFAALMSTFLLREDRWNAGVVDAPIQSFLAPGPHPPARWLTPVSPRSSLADPFGVMGDHRLSILVESYEGHAGQGHIAAVQQLASGGFSAPREAIRQPFHMSFPYVLEHGGRIYCLPETSAANEAVLYEAVSFPETWRRRHKILSGFAATDSTVFRHEGRWWLLCTGFPRDQNNEPVPGEAGYDALHAWYADDLMGTWASHALNPLKIDIRSSRPAGTPFVHEGRLYRPTQDNSRSYGGSIVINRVVSLTPTTFEEEPVAWIPPDPGSPYPQGLHTLSAVGDVTIIDGKREVFDVLRLPAKVMYSLARAIGWLTLTSW